MTGAKTFFGVIWDKQTWSNMLYLLISFPLGIFYFVFLVTGLALGFGLFITLLGIPILIGVMLAWHNLAAFERIQTMYFLKAKIPYKPTNYALKKNLWEKLKVHVSNSYTWKSLLYLFLKFPIGIISFVILVVFLSVSLSFVGTPVLYNLAEQGILEGAFCINGTSTTICLIDNYFMAFLAMLVGILFFFVSLHAFNGLAKSQGLLAEALLTKRKW